MISGLENQLSQLLETVKKEMDGRQFKKMQRIVGVSEEVAKGFKDQFNLLWKIARK